MFRSLHLHINDIRYDFYVKTVDIAIFVETGLIKRTPQINTALPHSNTFAGLMLSVLFPREVSMGQKFTVKRHFKKLAVRGMVKTALKQYL